MKNIIKDKIYKIFNNFNFNIFNFKISLDIIKRFFFIIINKKYNQNILII